MIGAAGGDHSLSTAFGAVLVEWRRNEIAMVRDVRKHLIRLAMLGTFSSRRRLEKPPRAPLRLNFTAQQHHSTPTQNKPQTASRLGFVQ